MPPVSRELSLRSKTVNSSVPMKETKGRTATGATQVGAKRRLACGGEWCRGRARSHSWERKLRPP